MSIYVDPDKIEGLGEKLRRFSLDVEEMDENLRRMILSYLDEVDAEYSESYVREVTREIRNEVKDASRLAAEVAGTLNGLSWEAKNAASEYRYKAEKMARTIAESSISFVLNMPLIKMLSGIYRVVKSGIEEKAKPELGFDPEKDYASLIAKAIKDKDYTNLQRYVDERDAKIASDKEKYGNVQTTGEYLKSLGYIGVRAYLNSIGFTDNQITYENGKVCVTVDGRKYALEIEGIVLTGYSNYASKENIEKALDKAEAGTINIPTPQYDTIEKKAQYYLSQLGFYIGLDVNGNPDIDGSWGNHSIIATLIFQNSIGIPITGTCDQTTLNKLEEAVNKGMTYDSIVKKFDPKDLPPVKGENGKLDITKLIKVKTNDKTDTYLTKETAVAWAYLVTAARLDGQDYKQLYPSHSVSGYRDYATQVRMYKELGPDTAAVPGTSNHGYGLAIDFSTTARGGQPRYGEGKTDMMIWLEDNANNFGFKPLLYDPKADPPRKGPEKIDSEIRINMKVNNYYESWHWNYKG